MYGLKVEVLEGLPKGTSHVDPALLVGGTYTVADDSRTAQMYASFIAGAAMREGYTAVQPLGEAGHWELSRDGVRLSIEVVETEDDAFGVYGWRVMAS